jgi:hypothetical protein
VLAIYRRLDMALVARRYTFDPRSIRARDTDQPPADLAGAE